MNKQFYTTKEISEMLGVHTRTVQRWIIAGKLTAIKVGKEYRIEATALKALLEANKTPQK